jgi:hypothetical protein
MAGNPTLPKENIDEVILGLLALEPNEVDELSYEKYNSYLKELLVEITSGKRKIDSGETELIKNEFKRVRGKKGRFRIVPKSSKVTATGLGLGGIRKQVRGAQSRLMLAPVGGVPKGKPEFLKGKDSDSDVLSRISNTLDSILKTLTDINKESKKRSDKERKEAEGKRRAGKEKEFESKIFDGVKNAVKGILKPFESIWSRIVKFITMILLGRTLLKLLDWFADPNNQGKIQSIIRFFKDHWPTLLALYLRFGTGIGRFVGRLGGILIKGAFKLGALAARLAVKAGLKGFSGAAKFLGGPRGRAIATGIGIAADVAVTAGTAAGISGLASGDIKIPGFSGGGWNKGFGNMFSGLVKGPKGKDKVPAMLTNGEFVVSAGAVNKYGVETFEAMNAAGGGTNIPQIASGVTYAAGGGPIGDIPLASSYGANPDVDTLRRAARVFSQFGTEEDLFKAFKKLNGVPDFAKMVGGKNIYERIFQGHHGYDDALDAIRQSVADKVKAVNNPQSFTQSSRAAAGLDDLAKKFDMDAKTAPRYAENLPKLNKPKPNLRGQFTNLKPDYFLRGQFSNLPADYFSKAAQNVRQPIPASRAIVPYGGGGLARTGVTAGLSAPQIQQIRTNMNVPGGRGGRGGIVGGILLSLAEIFKPQVQAAVGDLYDKMGIGEGNLSDAELKKQLEEQTKRVQKLQSGPMGSFMDGGIETDRLKFLQQEANKRKLAGLKGGAIKGGYKLKEQSFKDAPKTQVMTDDKGRPFVGYKAMRGGKLVYVRGSQPGTGTSNPLEMLGRAINPGAYKDIDARNERKKYEEASKNSIASLKARGASQATIARRQAELKKSVKPLPKPKPKPRYNPAGGGMGGGRGSGARPANSQKPKTQNPTHSANATRTARSTLGVNKK